MKDGGLRKTKPGRWGINLWGVYNKANDFQ